MVNCKLFKKKLAQFISVKQAEVIKQTEVIILIINNVYLKNSKFQFI